MKWLKWTLIGIAALLLFFAAVGLALPSQFRVERSVAIEAPAEKAYPLIASPAEWKRWSACNRRNPNMQVECAGPAAGAGARWSWRSDSEGSGTMEFTEAVPGQRLAEAS